jgi:hypothetical protein
MVVAGKRTVAAVNKGRAGVVLKVYDTVAPFTKP